MTECFDCT